MPIPNYILNLMTVLKKDMTLLQKLTTKPIMTTNLFNQVQEKLTNQNAFLLQLVTTQIQMQLDPVYP